MAPGWPLRKCPHLVVFTSPSWLQSPFLHDVVGTKLFLWFLKLRLKLITVLAFFTSLGIRFQFSITRMEKKFLLTSSLAAFCLRLSGHASVLYVSVPKIYHYYFTTTYLFLGLPYHRFARDQNSTATASWQYCQSHRNMQARNIYWYLPTVKGKFSRSYGVGPP